MEKRAAALATEMSERLHLVEALKFLWADYEVSQYPPVAMPRPFLFGAGGLPELRSSDVA